MRNTNNLHCRLGEFVTSRKEFWPTGGAHDAPNLLEVREGVSAESAADLAGCLEESVNHCLKFAVQDGLSSELAYLLWFASSTSNALRSAAGVKA